MYKLLLILTILYGLADSTIAWGTDCSKHRIYCRILELQPNVDHSWAMEFSNILHRKSKKYNLDPMLSIAIAMQETSLRPIDRTQKVITFKVFTRPDGTQDMDYEIVHGVTDVSIWQFHVETIIAYKEDPVMIKTDLEYATDFHFRLMRDKIHMCRHLDDEAWTCYHSATERLRERYKKDVQRYLPGGS